MDIQVNTKEAIKKFIELVPEINEFYHKGYIEIGNNLFKNINDCVFLKESMGSSHNRTVLATLSYKLIEYIVNNNDIALMFELREGLINKYLRTNTDNGWGYIIKQESSPPFKPNKFWAYY